MISVQDTSTQLAADMGNFYVEHLEEKGESLRGQ